MPLMAGPDRPIPRAKRLLSVKRPPEGWPGKPPKEVDPTKKRGGK